SSHKFVSSVAARIKRFGVWLVLGCARQVIQPKNIVIRPKGILSANICQLRRFSTNKSQRSMTTGSKSTDCLPALANRNESTLATYQMNFQYCPPDPKRQRTAALHDAGARFWTPFPPNGFGVRLSSAAFPGCAWRGAEERFAEAASS